MLAISPAASAAIETALDAASAPEGAGLRLAAGPMTEQGVAIEIALVEAAGPSDRVVETGAVGEVFLEPETAELLDDQVLDAELGPDGAISFSLHPQAPSMNGNGPSGA